MKCLKHCVCACTQVPYAQGMIKFTFLKDPLIIVQDKVKVIRRFLPPSKSVAGRLRGRVGFGRYSYGRINWAIYTVTQEKHMNVDISPECLVLGKKKG